MEKILNDYLEKIERYLKPLPISENVLILQKKSRAKSLNYRATEKMQKKLWNGWGIQKN